MTNRERVEAAFAHRQPDRTPVSLGTTIVVVGVFGEKPRVDVGLIQDRELSLVGTLMYQQVDYENAIELLNTGRMNLGPLITNHFPFDRYLDAYHAIEAAHGNTMKVMIDLD